VVACVPSSADVSARAVTILSPDVAKKLVVSLVVNVPANWEPSDMVTEAVASTVPAAALSAIVGLAGDKVIAVGTAPPGGGGGGGGGALPTWVMAHTVCVADMTRALFTTDRKFPVLLFLIVQPLPLALMVHPSPGVVKAARPLPLSTMNWSLNP